MSEEKSSLQLLFEFNAAAIAIPVVVLGSVYGYSIFFDVNISRQVWKTVFFITWIGTLLVFFREFLKTYIAYLLKKRKRNKKS